MGAFLISLQLHWQAPVRRGRRPTRTWLSILLGGVIVVAALLAPPAPPSHAAPLNDCAPRTTATRSYVLRTDAG